MLTAIIVAGGRSERMGFDKLLAPLADRTVLEYALAAFEQTDCVEEIVLVTREDRRVECENLVANEANSKVRHIVPGGLHRQDSVRAGLGKLHPRSDYVAVHDAARPLVTPAQIERVFAACRAQGGAALAEPVTDTLKRAREDRFVSASVDRRGLYAMQTPQIFLRTLLLEAYERVAAGNLLLTDEVSALQQIGRKVLLVPSEEPNFKITYPADLPLAEFILSRRRVK